MRHTLASATHAAGYGALLTRLQLDPTRIAANTGAIALNGLVLMLLMVPVALPPAAPPVERDPQMIFLPRPVEPPKPVRLPVEWPSWGLATGKHAWARKKHNQQPACRGQSKALRSEEQSSHRVLSCSYLGPRSACRLSIRSLGHRQAEREGTHLKLKPLGTQCSICHLARTAAMACMSGGLVCEQVYSRHCRTRTCSRPLRLPVAPIKGHRQTLRSTMRPQRVRKPSTALLT